MPALFCSTRGGGIEAHSSVHVSIASTGALVRAQSSHRILTQDDWKAFSLLRDPAARRSAIAARILLRLSLSRAVGREIAPQAWVFKRTPHGKPTVAADLPDIRFSVSHTEEVAIVAVSPELNIGVDVETIDQHLDRDMVEEFCHPGEKPAITGLPPHQRSREFLRLWTQKEAFTKLVGLGHSIEFATIDFSSPQAQALVPAIPDDQALFESFYLQMGHSLHHTSLAIQQPGLASDLIDLQLFDVLGPDAATGAPVLAPPHQ